MKHSNVNSNHLKRIRSIRIHRLTIGTKFETFECKFEPLERESNHSKVIRIQIPTILTIHIQIQTIWKDSKHSNVNSNHSKGSRIIWKGFEGFKSKFERDSKHSNENSNHSKGVRTIQFQIQTIWKGLECKFESFEWG